ncbi:hypothetical protein D9619_001530 [Psilocybe cf. subviscida]|uniref:NAD(P)-binding protein n=1 Tax=Psilocybe cf. subviscida TaxID=2480587 RepID=A0A8H5F2W6_9AGAR|nr:hypothetical protein D9619_001530 [Psilocybe cf. subviscida]
MDDFSMSHIADDQLFTDGDRVRGKVVVITGAANGIGRETALRFGAYGAKVVIGDLDITGAQKVVEEINRAGSGSAVCIKCNVTNWDDQVAMFELAMKTYGTVDVVVPNAGVSEVGSFQTLTFKDGKPVKPKLATLEVNLYGVLYSAHLGWHYLQQGQQDGDLKALIFIGSVASWQGIPSGEMYTGSKHAVLGVMRALHPIAEIKGIRVACIHPFFADTAIVPIPVKLILAGIPLTPVPRVAGAIFKAATDPDMTTSGSAYLLLDDGPVFRVPKEEFKLGVYKMIDDRANAARAILKGTQAWLLFFKDVWRITGKPIVAAGTAAAVSKLAWDNRAAIQAYITSVTS